MRLIDANELIEHAWRDKLDSRELIVEMIEKAPTVKEIPTSIPLDIFERLLKQSHAIPIPNNATNGDVIKAMFPNIITDKFASTIHATTKVVSNGVKGGISYDFWKEWWNAPYKGSDME